MITKILEVMLILCKLLGTAFIFFICTKISTPYLNKQDELIKIILAFGEGIFIYYLAKKIIFD